MKSTTGRPRAVTDEQVMRILKWHHVLEEWRAQRPKVPTIRAFARELGVSTACISAVVRRRGEYKQASPEQRHSEPSRSELPRGCPPRATR